MEEWIKTEYLPANILDLKKRFIMNRSSSGLSSTFKVVVAPNKRWPGLSEVRIVVSNETAAFGERAEGR